MCTIVMQFDDPLGATTSSRKALVKMDECDTSSLPDESPENNEEPKPSDPQDEENTSVQLNNADETQPVAETNTEEQNKHLVNANNWCIAVVTIVLCFLFFLYYCF